MAASDSAKGILGVFADNKIGPGQVMMLDWLRTLFVRKTQLGAADFEEGLAYAKERGWVSEHVSQIRLEDAGQEALAST